MDWKILVPPTIVGMAIFSVIFWRILIKIGYPLWARIFISCTCGGCLSHFGFMYLNQRFAQRDLITNSFNIERKGTLAKGRHKCGKL